MSTVLLQKETTSGYRSRNLLPLLSPEEEIKLFQKLERNPENEKVREEIIEKNIGLAKDLAKKIRDSHSNLNSLTLEDLRNAGIIGLIEAVRKFDWRKGYKFSTYAVHWIRREITMSIGKKSRMIRVPLHKISIISKYEKVRKELFNKLKRSPLSKEIAEKMEIELTKVFSLEKIKNGVISLESPLVRKDNRDKEEFLLIDTVEDKTIISPSLNAERKNLKEELIKSLSCLSTRERKILIMRFWGKGEEGYTLKEIGKILGGFTKQRIQQIESKALKKLRESDSKDSKLRTLLELLE